MNKQRGENKYFTLRAQENVLRASQELARFYHSWVQIYRIHVTCFSLRRHSFAVLSSYKTHLGKSFLDFNIRSKMTVVIELNYPALVDNVSPTRQVIK